MTDQLAFLSYTRKDDHCFGGYITSFRERLDEAVQVVTGEVKFKIFQDVEGIVIGERWKTKVSDVINDSSFLIPIMTPLFFNSDPCRNEVELFLERERKLGVDNLILPIYFFLSAKLEKTDERDKDTIAKELSERQRADWRNMATMSLDALAV